MEASQYFSSTAVIHWNELKLTDPYSLQVLNFLSPRSGELILDNGCGNGRFSLAMMNRGSSVISLDINKDIIKLAKKVNDDVIVADSLNLPFKDSVFDKVLCVHNLWYIPSYAEAVDEMLRTVKTECRIIFDQLNTKWYSRSNPVEQIYQKVAPNMPSFLITPKQLIKPLTAHELKIYHVSQLPLLHTILNMLFPFFRILERCWRAVLISGMDLTAHRWLVICQKNQRK